MRVGRDNMKGIMHIDAYVRVYETVGEDGVLHKSFRRDNTQTNATGKQVGSSGAFVHPG
jgi:hypothetical protein